MKVYNVKNMNEWGEMEQKEVNGVVVKVAVIGEQNDLQTGEKTRYVKRFMLRSFKIMIIIILKEMIKSIRLYV